MALRVRLARNVAVSPNDNISAFVYSVLITGCFAWMSALGHSPGVVEIFAANRGAVLAFLVFELIMLTVFTTCGINAERNRFITGLMRVILVPAEMNEGMLYAHYLTGAGARRVCGRHFVPYTAGLNIVVEAECGEAFRVLDPVVPHLDEQEQMHAAFEHAFEFGASTGPDRFDALAVIAEDNGALSGPAHKDDLIDPYAAVATLLP
jgi:hypothetical protein